jgi:hypothetical protein
MSDNKEKILVTISGYYERFQIDTVLSCIKRASNPERLSFALAYHEDHVIDLTVIPNKVKSYIVPKGVKAGIQPMKNKLFSMLEDEDFVLSIDSHVIMMQDWDKELTSEYYEKINAATNKKIVISGNFGNTINVGHLTYEDAQQNYFNSESFFTQKELNKPLDSVTYGNLFSPGGPEDYYGTVLSLIPVTTYKDSGPILDNLPTNSYSGNFSFFPRSWIDEGNSVSEDIFFSGDQPEMSMNIFSSGYDIWAPKLVYHCHMRDHKDGTRLQKFSLGHNKFQANEYFDIEKDVSGILWFLEVIKNGYPGRKRPRSIKDFFDYFGLDKKVYEEVSSVLLGKYQKLPML